MPLLRPSKPTTRLFRSLNRFVLLTPTPFSPPNIFLRFSYRQTRRKMGSLASAAAAHGTTTPFRILVAGGSYAGLSAALNIQDLCSGRAPRCGTPTEPSESDATANADIAVDITIVDERDGFCKPKTAPRGQVSPILGTRKKRVLLLGLPLTRDRPPHRLASRSSIRKLCRKSLGEIR